MKNIVIKGWMVGLLVLVVIFGGILLTIGTGHWKTTREGEPARLPTGDYDPGDIRGSYAFSEIEEFFQVPLDVLFQAFLIPEDQRKSTFQVKNMEGLFAPVVIDGQDIEVGTDLLRVFTALYTGTPYTSTETTHLPVSAVNVLLAQKKLNAEQTTYWQAHTFELQPASAAPTTAVGPKTEKTLTTQTTGTVEIKGKTTIGELRGYGLTPEQFKTITGKDMPDNNALGFRDFVTQNSLDMETVKAKILEVLTPAQAAPEVPQPSAQETPTFAQPEATKAPTGTLEIKGSTTIANLLDVGLTRDQFKTITGKEVPDDTAMKLKDFAEANTLDMEQLKEQILKVLPQ